MVQINKNIANDSNYGGVRLTSGIKYIVIHYTANDGDTDENNGKYFKSNIVKASAHYFVDSDSITQSVPDNYIAYSVAGNKYDDCAKTGGGKLYGVCKNANSLSIELCDDYKNGKVYPTAKTITNAIDLTKMLMKKYSVPADRVIRHFDVNGKPCPAYWTDASKWEKEFHSKLIETVSKQKVTTNTTVKVDAKKERIKTLQQAINKAYARKLTVDGVIGPKTTAELKGHILRNYTQNEYARWVQNRLKELGYDITIDGKYGPDTAMTVKAFQKFKGLTQDGICGYNTICKLI